MFKISIVSNNCLTNILWFLWYDISGLTILIVSVFSMTLTIYFGPWWLEECASSSSNFFDILFLVLGKVSCADTVVGDAKVRGISGGEKKRLSVACEMIASPSVIFADEPTTGKQ